MKDKYGNRLDAEHQMRFALGLHFKNLMKQNGDKCGAINFCFLSSTFFFLQLFSWIAAVLENRVFKRI